MSVGAVTARIARRICDVEPVGYSQPDRRTWFANADWEGHCSSPQNADCSSLAAGAVCYGLHDTYGVPWGHPALLEINDFWTGNLRQGLEARGFDEVNWENENLTPDGGFRAGDIVLSAANEGGVGHVVIVVEDGFDPLESEAWIAEDGSIDGYLGDQTGQETRTARYSTHPHTQAGRWTSCHRFNEAKFFQQWPEFAKGKASAPGPAPATPAPQAAPSHAHGIDVSSYQGGLYIPPIWADFVIVKASEDDDYVNPYKDSQAQDTLSSGKRLGFYHFARPGDAQEQARYFVDAVRGYLGKATLWLDWEANAVPQGPAWAKTFLDTVKALTGSTPGIYMNDSTLNGYDWSAVAREYPLWYADPTNYNTTYMGYIDPAVPSVPYWGQPLIHQYSQCGQLPGYNGNLDFDRLRDRAAWDAMIGGGHVTVITPASPVAQASPYTGKWNASDGQGELVCDGDLGPATIARFQQVMGTPIDGELDDDGSPAIERFQEFLNANVHGPSQEQLNGAPALDVDGVAGPATWRCFQFLVLAWHSDYVPAGWSFGAWIDGDPGEGTIRALQRALNNSHANSGRLW